MYQDLHSQISVLQRRIDELTGQLRQCRDYETKYLKLKLKYRALKKKNQPSADDAPSDLQKLPAIIKATRSSPKLNATPVDATPKATPPQQKVPEEKSSSIAFVREPTGAELINRETKKRSNSLLKVLLQSEDNDLDSHKWTTVVDASSRDTHRRSKSDLMGSSREVETRNVLANNNVDSKGVYEAEKSLAGAGKVEEEEQKDKEKEKEPPKKSPNATHKRASSPVLTTINRFAFFFFFHLSICP